MNEAIVTTTEESKELTNREKEWEEIENLVLIYQARFEEGATIETIRKSEAAAEDLLRRFSPFIKKYCTLIRTGNIDWMDSEMKSFVRSFIEDDDLQKALKRQKQSSQYRENIRKRFKFVVETYGSIQEEEILTDMQAIFLIIARRYKRVGRSFCGYLYNSYKYEVSRHIKKYIKNPTNIHYKVLEYEECANGNIDTNLEKSYEDNYYENNTGIPDMDWLLGKNCSDVFADLTVTDRKIFIKYYLEEWNDRQISEGFGIHINTVNQKRRLAVQKVAKRLGIEMQDIKRNRRSGKKAILPSL